MTTVNVHEAKTTLSKLLAQVEAGEEVVIARNGKPVAKLVSCDQGDTLYYGCWKGKVNIPDSFFDPMTEEELKLWYGD